MDNPKKEIELMDFLNILWKRKWIIIIPTLILVILAGTISFFLPKKWEVSSILIPSHFLFKTETGQYEEILVVSPLQIVGQVNEKSYNDIIAAALNLDIRKFPLLRATNLRDTNLVRISTRVEDVEKAKSILNALLDELKKDMDGKADIEIKDLDSQIKSNQIQKLTVNDEIQTAKKTLGIIRQRKKEIEEEMQETRERIKSLENEQKANLKKANRSDAESIAMLLYSNEIQQSLRYNNSLNELLNNKKIEEENTNLGIKNLEKRLTLLDNAIEFLAEKKGRIDKTRIVKPPTPSLSPVSPNKKLIVLITGFVSLMIFIIIAFFLEYREKQGLDAS